MTSICISDVKYMLSIHDFKEKQILFIESSSDIETKIKFSNENLIYTKNDEIVNQISCYKLLAIFIIGDLSFTTVLVKKLLSFGVSIFFLKNNFETYATIGSKAEGNYLLRAKQYEYKNDLFIARKLVENKTLNQLTLLKNAKKISVNESKNKFQEIKKNLEQAKNHKEILGIEGDMAKKFFKLYFKELNWVRRAPRAKNDVINFLMDIGYTYLFNYIDTLLGLYGFDTYKGFYHQLFFQRKSLPCDIEEPFRCIIDKQIIKSYNLKQIDEKDFQLRGGQYFLPYKNNRKYSKIFLEPINDYKEDMFIYVHQFYKFIQGVGDFPVFKIK